MKKLAALVVFVLLSSSAFADELIQMRGDLVFQRCGKRSDGSTWCSAPATNGTPIEISLTQSNGSTISLGQYNFELESDGFDFMGTISVAKMSSGQGFRYQISASVAWIKGNDPDTFSVVHLGNVSVSDISKLNEITFDGSKSIISGDVTLKPVMFIGPSN